MIYKKSKTQSECWACIECRLMIAFFVKTNNKNSLHEFNHVEFLSFFGII